MADTQTQAIRSTDFGRQMLDHWRLDPSITYLNHGTVGATPRAVLDVQQRLRDEIELQPARFMLRELTDTAPVGKPRNEPSRIRVAAARVAEFLGVRGDDLVFVDNATSGANAVLRSFRFEPHDEILITDLGYGAVRNAVAYVARERGISLRTAEVAVPGASPGAVVDAIASAFTSRTKLAIVDHIASDSALLLPVAEIASLCRSKGVRLLVDGAHAPGSIALDIESLGADWYVGNLHKWALAPRSSAVLWAAPDQRDELHPPVISWGLDQGFTAEFDLVGTRDPTTHLSAPAALDLLEAWGFERVVGYNHNLAWQGAQLLAQRWGTEFRAPRSMVATMVSVPLPRSLGVTVDEAAELRDALLFEDHIEVHVGAMGGNLSVRVAAQIYNEIADFELLAEAVERRLKRSDSLR